MRYSRSRGLRVDFFGLDRRNSVESRISRRNGERGMYVAVREIRRMREWRMWKRRGK
jgi:hypothetical protein